MNPQKKPFINLVSSLLRYSPEAALAIADRLEAEDRAGKLPVNWNSDYVKTRFSEHDSIQSLADEFENFFDFEDYPGRSDPKALIKATCVDPMFLDNDHVVIENSTKNWEKKNPCLTRKDLKEGDL